MIGLLRILKEIYRYYNQTAADYFAGYEQHNSGEEFYTSDYDLLEYNSHQYGFEINHTDIFTEFHISSFGLKSVNLKYNHFERDSGLKSNIITGGLNFVMD